MDSQTDATVPTEPPAAGDDGQDIVMGLKQRKDPKMADMRKLGRGRSRGAGPERHIGFMAVGRVLGPQNGRQNLEELLPPDAQSGKLRGSMDTNVGESDSAEWPRLRGMQSTLKHLGGLTEGGASHDRLLRLLRTMM
ncbi:hypothetical protein NDU88_003230 [Pleurodeles waltl]|uniref:Uncharacterized protein n=1 Tax=Pleurodeles waltl TaxID=8319 RepID=A0AAV7V0Q6_PLEWA|nr:hypothetical protein NDU88_003230 [Pleurodeles waltl]